MLLLPARGAPGQGLSYGAVPCAGAAAGWAVKRETLALCLHLLEKLPVRCPSESPAQEPYRSKSSEDGPPTYKTHSTHRMLALQQGNCPQEEGRDSSLGRLLGKVLVVQAGGLEFHPLSPRLQKTEQNKQTTSRYGGLHLQAQGW